MEITLKLTYFTLTKLIATNMTRKIADQTASGITGFQKSIMVAAADNSGNM